MTVLTLPAAAGEGNQAVCGKLRQFTAVDAKAAEEAGCNSDAATRGMRMMKKEGGQDAYKAIERAKWQPGCRKTRWPYR